ncbi:ribosome biogenesis GTPase Der [Dongia deserti]|uniref:ribosome biogenesis GTPase Der n=1 Tax=Dongia deserti TaxID=2268030 RepID=UPI000E655AAB|nr:ribosome biogenesis GTPase Der [Dongia deserti]
MAFTVAIVGRPNVGKSTLFNRLVGKRLALVDDQPGVTRDRRFGAGHLGDLDFTAVDTAGLEDVFDESLEARMREQTEEAIRHADVALLLIDARAGITPLDEHFARRLRKTRTPILLIANKCESRAAEAGLGEAFRLGLGAPIAISAEHGEGMGELYDALRAVADRKEAQLEDVAADPDAELEALPEDEAEAPKVLQLAIVGRPNVGKSTLANALLGEERLLTGPEAGITRDAIAIDWEWKGTPIRLIDTAGLRRRARVVEKLERLSGADTDRAVRYAHVVVLVLDANDMLEKQDLTIARHVVEEGRALVIAANKWDAIEDKTEALKRLKERVEKSLPQVAGVPIVTLSARSGRNLDKLMQAVLKIYDEWSKRVPTAQLNRYLEAATVAHPPPLVRGRRIKLRYMTQIKTRPPTFTLFAAKADELPDAYARYLVNGIRERFDLKGTPIRLYLRRTDNPFVEKA